MSTLMPLILDELEVTINNFTTIERAILLKTPKIEDGNNFGVDVQREVLKTVVDRSQILGQYSSDLSSYHWSRGAVMERGWGGKRVRVGVEEDSGVEEKKGVEGRGEKVIEGDDGEDDDDDEKEEEKGEKKKRKTNGGVAVVAQSNESSLTPPSDPNFMPGGKKKKTTTTTTSSNNTSSSTTTTNNTITKKHTITSTDQLELLPDYKAYLITYDLKWYVFVREAFRVLGDSMVLVWDVVEKNYGKT
jgi:hypothetical protein